MRPKAQLGLLARVQRYLLLGDFTPTAPHIVFLDAGLAASFDDRIFGTAQSFFDAVTRTDGPAIGKAILGLAPTQPYVEARIAIIIIMLRSTIIIIITVVA